MVKRSILATIFACLVLSLMAGTAMAAEGIVSYYGSAGYFLPNEGDLQGNGIVGIGMKFKVVEETMFLDINYTQSSLEFSTTQIGDIDQIIAQLGIIKPLYGKLSYGGGVQFQSMDIGGTIKDQSRLNLLGVLEYDFNKDWTVRASSSTQMKDKGVRFGGTGLAIMRNF
jgi:hypothetical protein